VLGRAVATIPRVAAAAIRWTPSIRPSTIDPVRFERHRAWAEEHVRQHGVSFDEA
jgi:hypothetical protein